MEGEMTQERNVIDVSRRRILVDGDGNVSIACICGEKLGEQHLVVPSQDGKIAIHPGRAYALCGNGNGCEYKWNDESSGPVADMFDGVDVRTVSKIALALERGSIVIDKGNPQIICEDLSGDPFSKRYVFADREGKMYFGAALPMHGFSEPTPLVAVRTDAVKKYAVPIAEMMGKISRTRSSWSL